MYIFRRYRTQREREVAIIRRRKEKR